MFQTDAAVETAGIDLDYGDFAIRIARAGGGNQKYIKLLGERMKPHRRKIENGTLDNAAAERLLAEVYADSVIVGWTHVTDADGKPMEFTRAACVKLLLDLPELFRDIQDQAGRVANFRKAEIEADARD
jgi:hypothetical protein